MFDKHYKQLKQYKNHVYRNADKYKTAKNIVLQDTHKYLYSLKWKLRFRQVPRKIEVTCKVLELKFFDCYNKGILAYAIAWI